MQTQGLREINKSNYLKLWLVGFVTFMAYRQYHLHGLNHDPSHHSIIVVLVGGIAFYLYGSYKLVFAPNRNYQFIYKAIGISILVLGIGISTHIFKPELTAAVVMLAWFLGAFLNGLRENT